MSDSFEFTLHSPLTKEDWDKILDVELEKTKCVTFQTPKGIQVRYVKCDVLDKIRAEIGNALSEEILSDNRQQISDVGIGLEIALSIIDKYKSESEE